MSSVLRRGTSEAAVLHEASWRNCTWRWVRPSQIEVGIGWGACELGTGHDCTHTALKSSGTLNNGVCCTQVRKVLGRPQALGQSSD